LPAEALQSFVFLTQAGAKQLRINCESICRCLAELRLGDHRQENETREAKKMWKLARTQIEKTRS